MADGAPEGREHTDCDDTRLATARRTTSRALLRGFFAAAVAAAATISITGCGGDSGRMGTLSHTAGQRRASGPESDAAALASGGSRGRRPRAAARNGAGGSAGPSSARNRGAFIRAADKVCGPAHTQAARVGRRLSDLVVALQKRRLAVPRYYARSSALTARGAKIAVGAVAALKALPRPNDRRIDQYLTLSAAQAKILASEAKALGRRDGRTVQKLNIASLAVGRRSHDVARRYGFHICGGGS